MSDSPLIAITGASGLLGRPLFKKLLTDTRYRVRGSAYSRAAGSLDRVDITSPDAVLTWLDDAEPSALIHLAAERRPNVCEKDPEAAERLNVEGTAFLADLCRSRKIPMLFLSTNYVFDGSKAPYSPGDEARPLNAYGRSKREGELKTIELSDQHRVLRIPMLYGPSDNLEESSVTTIAKALRESDRPVPLDVRQTRYPVFSLDVADAIIGLLPELIDGRLPGPYLHFCPGSNESFTKQEMGEILAPYVGASPDRAVPDEEPVTGAPRPENVRLSCPALEARGLLRTTSFRKAIAMTMESIRAAGGLS